MLKSMRSIDLAKAGRASFWTLTYGSDYPTDGRVVKKHLDTFLKALSRRCPDAWAFWRLGTQRRGCPHFHLLVFGLSVAACRAWVESTWTRITGGDSQGAATQVASVRSWERVTNYIAKVEKNSTALEHCGRFWGLHNRAGYEQAVSVESRGLLPSEFHPVKRAMLRLYRSRGRSRVKGGGRNSGLWLFIERGTGDALWRYLARLRYSAEYDLRC